MSKSFNLGAPCRGVISICVAVVALSSCNHPVSKDVAATVNGRPVTYAQLDRALAAQLPNPTPKTNADQSTQLKLEALRALIDNEILLQRAEREGLLAS